ncbi:NADH-cytochrome b5 reductase [Dispira parvispora]|uniref:NADH-cytochrome b5 reductase n=1 Tax=Dispira parvispora TaxID=1520584 RepID=A0A9W8ATT5_9FUNG|nr:NADH-cytochrome b5 reductase [Dispira parvispora]
MISVIAALLLAGVVVYFVIRTRETSPVLDKQEYRQFPLVKKIEVSHNTAIYRLALPKPTDVLGLPIGQHISVMANIDGKDISRSYTPTSAQDATGYFDLLIKTYEQGNISRMFSELKIGEKVNVRGPKGKFSYTPNMCRALGMIAGGTGITPMLQIIHAIVKNPADRTQVSLLFANVNEEDILLKAELDALQAEHKNITVHYVLNNPPEKWTGGVGFVTEEMIRNYLPSPAEDIKILLCGPPPMTKAMCQHCETIGYHKAEAVSKLDNMVFKF